MSFTTDPLVTPGEWDVLYAAGQPSPGIFTLAGGQREYKWDVKEAPGSQGATRATPRWSVAIVHSAVPSAGLPANSA